MAETEAKADISCVGSFTRCPRHYWLVGTLLSICYAKLQRQPCVQPPFPSPGTPTTHPTLVVIALAGAAGKPNSNDSCSEKP